MRWAPRRQHEPRVQHRHREPRDPGRWHRRQANRQPVDPLDGANRAEPRELERRHHGCRREGACLVGRRRSRRLARLRAPAVRLRVDPPGQRRRLRRRAQLGRPRPGRGARRALPGRREHRAARRRGSAADRPDPLELHHQRERRRLRGRRPQRRFLSARCRSARTCATSRSRTTASRRVLGEVASREATAAAT